MPCLFFGAVPALPDHVDARKLAYSYKRPYLYIAYGTYDEKHCRRRRPRRPKPYDKTENDIL